MAASTKPKSYVCVVGMDHPKGRHERGETYEGPTKSLDWLVEQGLVVEAGSDEAAAIADELAADTENTEG